MLPSFFVLAVGQCSKNELRCRIESIGNDYVSQEASLRALSG